MSDDYKLQGFAIGPIDDGVPSYGVASKFGSEDSPPQPDLTVWISSATGHDADRTAGRLTGEDGKRSRASLDIGHDLCRLFRTGHSSLLRNDRSFISQSAGSHNCMACGAQRSKKVASITTNKVAGRNTRDGKSIDFGDAGTLSRPGPAAGAPPHFVGDARGRQPDQFGKGRVRPA